MVRSVATVGVSAGALKSLDVAGSMLVTGGADGRARMLGPDLDVRAESPEHDDIINMVRAGPRGVIVTASRDAWVRVWDPASGDLRAVGRHDDWVGAATFTPDGERIVSVSEDGTLRWWDAAGGGEIARLGLGAPANDVDARGSLIAVACGDRALYLLDEQTRRASAVRGARQMLWGARFSPNGARVAFTSRDRIVRVANIASGAVAELAGGHAAQVWSAMWHPDGTRLASASADRSVVVWENGSIVDRIPTDGWARAAAWLDDDLFVATDAGTVSRATVRDDARDRARIALPSPPDACPHVELLVTKTTKSRCEECGSRAQLRLCLACGHVGCCESQLAHGTKHWEATGHPGTTPVPVRAKAWRWCYECDGYIKRIAA